MAQQPPATKWRQLSANVRLNTPTQVRDLCLNHEAYIQRLERELIASTAAITVLEQTIVLLRKQKTQSDIEIVNFLETNVGNASSSLEGVLLDPITHV